MSAAPQRISASLRLMALPPVFSRAELIRVSGLGMAWADLSLCRWAKKGLIKAAGPRAGWYYNEINRGADPEARLTEVILRQHPDAVVVGDSVLWAAGWVTQIPQTISIAVSGRRNMAKIDGVTLLARPRGWLGRQPATRNPDGLFGIPALRPEHALADRLKHRDGWIPGADDLDIDREQWSRVTEAAALFSTPLPDDLSSEAARQTFRSKTKPVKGAG